MGGAFGSLILIAIRYAGWRFAFKGMGFIGVLIGMLVILFIKEPKKNNVETKSQDGNLFKAFFGSLYDLMKLRTTRYVTLAAMMNAMAGYASMFFMPAFFQANYPNYQIQFT